MKWNDHSRLSGTHSFLSASQSSWLRYTDESLINHFRAAKAAQEGTELHAIAAKLISKGIKLPHNGQNLSNYVNDAIGYKMSPEVVLYYSDVAYGTADAISFRRNLLRIDDLKTGKTPVHMDQLKIYASYFCLGYSVKPADIHIELRIYQNGEIQIEKPEHEEIEGIIAKIVHFDKLLSKEKNKEEDY